MKDQEEQSIKEAKREEKSVGGKHGESSSKRVEKRAAEEAQLLAKEQVRKKAYLAREKAVEEASQARETKRTEMRAAEESGQSAKDQARKDAYLAREQAIAKDQEARKIKAKKQPPK